MNGNQELFDLHVFTAGDQISTSGTNLKYTESELDEMVDSYNPELHEAPVILGHDESSGSPSAGWVKSLYRAGKDLFAKVHFTESGKSAITSGEYKKRSSSFYRPESAVNPAKGKWSYRHLALLGGSVPAVKGLQEFSFMETTEDFLAFEETDIDETLEFATAVAPEEEVVEEAVQAVEEIPEVIEETSAEETPKEEPVEEVKEEVEEVKEEVAEHHPEPETPDPGMVQLAERIAVLESRVVDKTAEIDALVERVNAAELMSAELVKEKRMAEMEGNVQEIYAEGRLTEGTFPKAKLLNYMEGLEFGTLEFAEGETPTSGLIELLKRLPLQVDFSEIVGEVETVEEFEETQPDEPVHERARKLSVETGLNFTESLKRVMFPEAYVSE